MPSQQTSPPLACACAGLIAALGLQAAAQQANPPQQTDSTPREAAPADAGGDAASVRERVRDALAGLGAPSWEDRNAATATLVGLAAKLPEESALGTLERLFLETIERPELADAASEIASRFEAVAATVFYEGPRAGLGVSFGADTGGQGLRLGRVIESFDAYTKLRENDVITAIAGVPITGRGDEATIAIISHLPGESATIDFIRDGTPRSASVRFGRRDALGGARNLADAHLRRAWNLRVQRLRGQLDEGALVAQDTMAVVRVPGEGPPGVGRSGAAVAVGGEPVTLTTDRRVLIRRDPRLAQNNPDDLREALADVERELQDNGRQIASVRRRALRLEEEMASLPDTPEGRRRVRTFVEQMAEFESALTELIEQRQSLMRDRGRLLQALSR